MQNLGGQKKSIMVFSEVAYLDDYNTSNVEQMFICILSLIIY